MKARPILFSSEMVRALLDGSKTQTRRVLKQATGTSLSVECDEHGVAELSWLHGAGSGYPVEESIKHIACPYGQPGDLLLVAIEIPSLGRKYCAGSNGIIYSRARGDWRPLKAHGNGNGYPCVTVMDGSCKTTRAVHSLVCEAFYGAAPFSGAQVRHLDGDPSNNIPENLAWGTQAENWRDRRAQGNGIEGEKHHAARLTDEERAHVRWAIQNGLCSQRHAARALGMSQGTIYQVIEGCELRNIDQDIPSGRIPTMSLRITSVRVERLQEISQKDAIAEGVSMTEYGCHKHHYPAPCLTAVDGYRELWESINGAGAWDKNPWVWCVGFEVMQKNILEVPHEQAG